MESTFLIANVSYVNANGESIRGVNTRVGVVIAAKKGLYLGHYMMQDFFAEIEKFMKSHSYGFEA